MDRFYRIVLCLVMMFATTFVIPASDGLAESRCRAVAQNADSETLAGTAVIATSPDTEAACQTALRQCESKIDKGRFPKATCQVMGKAGPAEPQERIIRAECTVQAETNDGTLIPTVEGKIENLDIEIACTEARKLCLAKLDLKRYPDADCLSVYGEEQVQQTRSGSPVFSISKRTRKIRLKPSN